MSEKIIGSGLQVEWMRTDEQWDKLRKFAASFDHDIVRNYHPVMVLKMDGRWIGFAQHYKNPLVITGWHTDRKICSPRDMLEGYKALAGWAKIQHSGAMTAAPFDTRTFTPEIMKKLGLHARNAQLYEILANE